MRISEAALDTWRHDGVVLVPSVFSPDEIAPVLDDYRRVHPVPTVILEATEHEDLGERIGRFDPRQFSNFLKYPFDTSVQMNLLPLHPVLIDAARRALGVEDVFMYQCHTWAKFTGEADYTQEFHFDFGNHTLLVPGDEKHFGTVNYVIYLTEVTRARGALVYVPRTVSEAIALDDSPNPGRDAQRRLCQAERAAEGPPGSLLIYDTHVYHRGTNLTEPGAHRYTMTVSYRASAYDAFGGNEWARDGHNAPWRNILPAASIDQLAVLGIPRPGHDYWTERTIRRVQARYPAWNLDPWRAALR